MNITLGTVVSLKSNGLLPSATHNFLSLGGNENFTIPLMIVVEILFNTQSDIDEETGQEKANKKGKNQYKCLYFSNKAMKLEENWFYENELEKYSPDNLEIHNNSPLNDVKWGDTVRFKTVDAEADKKKSFNESEKNKGSKPLLSYTSPAFQVVGFVSVDKKDPLIDSYNGAKKREKSEKLVKCKFFNSESDKFSEQLVPIECLQKVDNSNLDKRLMEVSDLIASKDLALLEINDQKYFGRPISVHVLSGRYQLIFWNELLKKNVPIWLDHINEISLIDVNDNSEYYPGVHKVSGKEKVIDVHTYISQNKKTIKKLKIVYRNLKEEIVSRYISVNKIGESLKDEENGEFKTVFYLKSDCYLRQAEREFRSDRILSLRTIENDALLKFLTAELKRKND